MGLLKALVKTVVELPIAAVKDAVTFGGIAIEEILEEIN